jgi:hypothetical protein
MSLRCSNPECESYENDQHLFHIDVDVDADRDLVENLKKLDAVDFECSFCHAPAEDGDVQDEAKAT